MNSINMSGKLIILSSVLIISLYLIGCAGRKEHTDSSYVDKEAVLLQQAVDDFFHAVDNRDAEAIKNMFAPNTVKDAEGIEEAAEQLFSFYPNQTDSCEISENSAGEYTADYGKRTAMLKDWFPVLSGDETYYCHVTFTYRDDIDQDNLGFRQVVFASEKVECSDDFEAFTEHFGEPNAVTCPCLVFAYELPDEEGGKR